MSWILLNCSDGWKAFESRLSWTLTSLVYPQRVNDGKLFVCTETPWLLHAGGFFSRCFVLPVHSQRRRHNPELETSTSAGFIQEQARAWGRWQQLLSANLPVDIVALLADRQPGLVGGQIPSLSRLSFPIKPFHLNVQSTPWQAKKWGRIRRY